MIQELKALRSRNKELEQALAEAEQRDQTLLESEKKYRTLFENTGAQITYCALDGEILLLNQKSAGKLNGVPDDFIGKSIFEILPKSSSELKKRFRNIAETKTGGMYEDCVSLTDGDRWFVSHNHPVSNADGEVFAIQVVSQDVTEQKLLQEQLLQAQKMKAIGTLAGGVAHDINNILTVVLGIASLLDRETPESDPKSDYIKQLIASTERGAKLTTNLLGFARQGQHLKEVVVLNRIIEEITQLLKRTIPKKVSFEAVDLPGDIRVAGSVVIALEKFVNITLK